MAVLCGNCKGYHDTAGDVRACYQGAGFGPTTATLKATADTAKMEAPATEKQLRFLEDLRRAAGLGLGTGVEHANVLRLAFQQLGRLIGVLVALPNKPKEPGRPAPVDLEDGIYEKDGTFFKVYHTIHGNNSQVAKRAILTQTEEVGENGKPKWLLEWDYVGKKGLRGLLPIHKLDEAAAKEFGMVYGWCVFGHALTREQSLYVGYGPTCAANNGWWYPTKAELRTLIEAGAAKASA